MHPNVFDIHKFKKKNVFVKIKFSQACTTLYIYQVFIQTHNVGVCFRTEFPAPLTKNTCSWGAVGYFECPLFIQEMTPLQALTILISTML